MRVFLGRAAAGRGVVIVRSILADNLLGKSVKATQGRVRGVALDVVEVEHAAGAGNIRDCDVSNLSETLRVRVGRRKEQRDEEN